MATKSKKILSGSTIAIIVLSILLSAAIAVSVALAYFTASTNVAGTITLGDPVTVSITQGGSAVSSLTFSGSALPGSRYSQVIGISAPANMTEALMRAKLTITNADTASVNVQATTAANWTLAEDEYYYYYGTVNANDSVDFVSEVIIPTTLTNADANKTYTLSVIVETIQKANNAANATWLTAPSAWLAQYSPTAQ